MEANVRPVYYRGLVLGTEAAGLNPRILEMAAPVLPEQEDTSDSRNPLPLMSREEPQCLEITGLQGWDWREQL